MTEEMAEERTEPFILFAVAGATYALRSNRVLRVEMVGEIARVPNAPTFVEGVAHVRGQMIPVVNVRGRFNLESAPRDLRARLIVIQVGERVIGMLVDSAREFVKLAPDQIAAPPEELSGPGLDYLEGVISLDGRLVLVVDLEKLFGPAEKEQLNEGLGEVNSQHTRSDPQAGEI